MRAKKIQNSTSLYRTSSLRSINTAQVVLEEEDYMTRMETIIERDFFPDIPKLQSELEWLEAVRSGDPRHIRKVQLNIAARHSSNQTTQTTKTCSCCNQMCTGAMRRNPKIIFHEEKDTESIWNISVSSNVTLDEFCTGYIGENNAAFQNIIQRRAKNCFSRKDNSLECPLNRMHNYAPKIANLNKAQYSEPGVMWKWRARNPLYFGVSDEAALNIQELKIRLNDLMRHIDYAATRFKHKEGSSTVLNRLPKSENELCNLCGEIRNVVHEKNLTRANNKKVRLSGRNVLPCVNRRLILNDNWRESFVH